MSYCKSFYKIKLSNIESPQWVVKYPIRIPGWAALFTVRSRSLDPFYIVCLPVLPPFWKVTMDPGAIIFIAQLLYLDTRLRIRVGLTRIRSPRANTKLVQDPTIKKNLIWIRPAKNN